MAGIPQLAKAGDDAAPAWQFLPVTIAFACDETTPQTARRMVERSPKAEQSVYGPQCVDQRRQVANIKPTSMRLVHLKTVGIYELSLQLPADEASALKELTRGANGQAVIVLVSDKAVVDSKMNAPFSGQVFMISADSEEAGVRMASLFVK